MQYNANTPEEYINEMEKDWRFEKLQMIRSIIHSKAPDLAEGIEYKMLSYGDNDGNIIHLNAQKNFVGLYVGNAKKIDIDGNLLEGLDMGKGCIRFKKSTLVSEENIGEFIRRTVKFRKQGKDIGC